MQAEEAVEVDDLLARNVDAGPHRVIGTLGVGHDDVEAVGRAALEDHDQALVGGGGIGGAQGGAGQKVGMAAVPTTAIAPPLRNVLRVMLIAGFSHSETIVSGHRRWNSGEPSSNRNRFVLRGRRCVGRGCASGA